VVARIRSLRRLAVAVAAVAAVAVSGSAARADESVRSSGPSCDGQTLEQPFLAWGDPASYVLAPDGGLEAGGAGWALSNGAAVVDGNEPFSVHADSDSRSLALPPGSSATSAPMCIGVEHSDMRIVTRNTGSLSSTLAVDVVYRSVSGHMRSRRIGELVAGSGWAPSVSVALGVNRLAALPPYGYELTAAFRFTPQGEGGDWQLDDVYVDPWRH
jgi:hypothetical protein